MDLEVKTADYSKDSNICPPIGSPPKAHSELELVNIHISDMLDGKYVPRGEEEIKIILMDVREETKTPILSILTPEFSGAEYKIEGVNVKTIYDLQRGRKIKRKKTWFDRYWDSKAGPCCACCCWLLISIGLVFAGSTLDKAGKINGLTMVGMITLGASSLIFLVLFLCWWYFENNCSEIEPEVLNIDGVMILIYSFTLNSCITKKFKHYDKIELIPVEVMSLIEDKCPKMRVYSLDGRFYKSLSLEVMSTRIPGEEVNNKFKERLSKKDTNELKKPV